MLHAKLTSWITVNVRITVLEYNQVRTISKMKFLGGKEGHITSIWYLIFYCSKVKTLQGIK